jgi:hypothetical protein
MYEVLDVDPAQMSGAELSEWLIAFETSHTQWEATRAAVEAEWDSRQAWAVDGALSGATWMRNRLGTTTSTAREQLRVARRLRLMPVAAAAFKAGELSYEKVRRLTDCRTDATAEVFDRDERMLVDFGRRFDGDEFAKVVRHWKRRADETGAERDARALFDGRHGSVSETLDGAVKVDAEFDPEPGRLFKGVFEAIDQEFFRADRRDAESAGDPTLIRPARQRRADALVEMARRAASSDPETARRPRPETMVIIDYRTLLAESGGLAHLDNRAMVTGEAARRLACDSGIVRVVTNGGSEILDLGRSTPVPSAAQRRAVILRDGGCTFAGCDMPPGRCEVHHIVPYGRGRDVGGPTDRDNLALVCTRHHHLVHEGGYRLSRNPVTGGIETRRPDGTLIPSRPRAGPLDPSGQGDDRFSFDP